MSKFCSKCGNKLADETAFCPKCGEKCISTQDSIYQSTENHLGEQPTHQKTKSKKSKLIMILIPSLALVVVCAIIMSILVIPEYFIPKVKYSEGASENDSMYKYEFEDFLNECKLSIEKNFDSYKDNFIEYNNINDEQSKYVFNDVYNIKSGEDLSDLLCDKNNWEYEDGAYNYAFLYNDFPLNSIIINIDKNTKKYVTGVSFVYGYEDETINIIEELMIQIIASSVTETILDIDKDMSINLIEKCYENNYDRYIINQSVLHFVGMGETNLLSINAVSKKALDNNVLEETEYSKIIYLTESDLK